MNHYPESQNGTDYQSNFEGAAQAFQSAQLTYNPQEKSGNFSKTQLASCVNLLKNLIRIAEQNNSIVESVAGEAVESLSKADTLTEQQIVEIQERIDFLKEINKMNASFNSGLNANLANK